MRVDAGLDIPDDELRFTFDRSGGPGGQNVNKVNTRATLWFDVAGSATLSMAQRELLLSRLANRLDSQGQLRIVAQSHRTQAGNRAAALDRFVTLLAEALRPRRPRRPTRPTRASSERRLKEKTRRSATKRLRQQDGD